MDLTEEVTNGIFNFVQGAHNDYQGVLIHSVNGRNRCCIAALIVLMSKFRWGLVKSLEFINAKKPGLEMTASLLKKLLQLEGRLEKDMVRFLSKDWTTLYVQGEQYQEEVIVTNSFKNSQKADAGLSYYPQKRSRRRGYGVRWREQNEIYDLQEIKDNIEGATKQKAVTDSPKPQVTTPTPKKPAKDPNAPTILAPPGTSMTTPTPSVEKSAKTDDLITNVNEDDMRERAEGFQDEDEDAIKPLVLGNDTYAELFENRKAPKDRRPVPSVQDIVAQKANLKTVEDIIASSTKPDLGTKGGFGLSRAREQAQSTLEAKSEAPSQSSAPTSRIHDYSKSKRGAREQSPPPADVDSSGIGYSQSPTRTVKDASEHYGTHHQEAVRGPYMNPTRTSQEQAMRLSLYKDQNKT